MMTTMEKLEAISNRAGLPISVVEINGERWATDRSVIVRVPPETPLRDGGSIREKVEIQLKVFERIGGPLFDAGEVRRFGAQYNRRIGCTLTLVNESYRRLFDPSARTLYRIDDHGTIVVVVQHDRIEGGIAALFPGWRPEDSVMELIDEDRLWELTLYGPWR